MALCLLADEDEVLVRETGARRESCELIHARRVVAALERELQFHREGIGRVAERLGAARTRLAEIEKTG